MHHIVQAKHIVIAYLCRLVMVNNQVRLFDLMYSIDHFIIRTEVAKDDAVILVGLENLVDRFAG